jgi:two-component system, OmpR family, osmolarity sensor histidine kinase EnvZ
MTARASSTYARVLFLQFATVLLVMLVAALCIRWYALQTSAPLARQAYAQLRAADALQAGDATAASAALQGHIVLRQQAPPLSQTTQPFLEKLRQQIALLNGDDTAVRLSDSPDSRIWLRSARDKNQWFGLPVNSFRDSAIWTIMLILGGACLIALLAAALIARLMVRPLEQLAAAADHLVNGQIPNTSLRHAPTEVRSLAASIQSAAGELARVRQERELMLAGVSHDLRTPLARLRFALEMADENDAHRRAAMLADLAELDQIIEGCLTLVRDGQDEARQPVDLQELAKTLIATSLQASSWAIQCDARICLLARPTALRRALSNLISNAEKYAQPPFVIEITLLAEQIRLRVIDHGTGIAATLLPSITQPFVRGDQARSGTGVGLGLSVAVKLLAADGATLHIQNSQDGGARVDVLFAKDNIYAS